LVGNLLGVRGAEARAAHRRGLESELPALGEALHQVVASSVIAHRRVRGGQMAGVAGTNGLEAAEVLKQKRLMVRYPLSGIEDALRSLSRLPNWAATYRGHESGDDLIRDAQGLSAQVDKVIARSYRRGRPPNAFERRSIRRQTERLRLTWSQRFGGDDEDDSNVAHP
jgi:hypothetical protein